MTNLNIELIRPPSQLFEMMVGGFWAINISGEIGADADKQFLQFMQDTGAPDRIDVYLDSPGGSLIGGIALGRQLRARQMNTKVGKIAQNTESNPENNRWPGICCSACTLSYLGGWFRFIDKES